MIDPCVDELCTEASTKSSTESSEVTGRAVVSSFWVALLIAAVPMVGSLGCSNGHSRDSETPAAETTPTSTAVRVAPIDPPVGAGAMSPNLTESSSGTYLTWLEPGQEKGAHAVYVSKLGSEPGGWSEPELVVEASGFFANWADLPAVTESRDGARFVHWLSKLGEETYAYGAMLARSEPGSDSWTSVGLLHDDDSPSEHGFVSYVPLDEGGIQAFWLDGRKMPGGGDMQLRTTQLLQEPQASEILDERVCECCSTDATLTPNGPMVVYRDRSSDEIRDIAVVRATADGWSEPVLIHEDGWQIHGCPVNGPSISADGDQVVVAWFTASGVKPSVRAALSTDRGAHFSEPVVIDDQAPLGRVDTAYDAQGRAVVSWMGTSTEGVEIRFRTVDDHGELGEVFRVTDTSGNRSAGVPRIVRHQDRLLFAWVEDQKPSTLRAGLVDLANR